MLTAALLQVIQSVVVLAFAPLFAGVLARAEAMVASKGGPGVLQPYRDLAKWLRKSSVVSDQASWVFRGAPFVAFACYLTVSVIVPIITSAPLPLAFLGDLIGGAFVLSLASFALSLAALDTASPLGGLGSSRASWIGSLAEPALVLVFFTVGCSIRVRQPVPDEPRRSRLAVRAGATDPPAGHGGVFSAGARGERPHSDREPGGDHRDLHDRGGPGAGVLPTPRHSAIFAYSERPGVIGTPERTQQLFGRVTPEHLAAAGAGVRVDQLMD